MKWLNFNKALGLNLSPFAPNKACDPYSMIGQLGAANLSMLGNYYSTQDSNQTNRRIARETNAQNYQIWHEQLAAQREQYERERQENRFLVDQAYQRSLPTEVVKNLKAAGINPAFALDANAFSTQQTSVGNNPSSSVPQAPEMVTGAPNIPVDFSSFGVGVGNAVANFLQSQKNEADISYLTLKGQNETAETIAKIRNMDKNSKYLNQLADNLEQEFKFNAETWKHRTFNIEAQGNLMVAQENLAKAEKVVQDEVSRSHKLENAFRECTNPLRARQMLADIALTCAQKSLAQANANSINELLPYQQNLMKQQFVSMINADANAFEQLGINLKSLGIYEGHAHMDYMSDWIDPLFKGLGTGAGLWLGLRTFGKSPVKIKGF